MMKIGLIGRGTVGDAVYNGLEHIGHDMGFFDPKFAGSRLEDVLDTEIVFICVPTDSKDNGDCDTSIVEKTIRELSEAQYSGLACIKSTVVPGTTERLRQTYPYVRIGCVPEFLRAKIALADFVYNHDILVVGVHGDEDRALVKQSHGMIPKKVAFVTPTEAEIIKYFNNVHHAMSVVFANITYEVSQKLGADYQRVFETITQRDCFNPHYLNVHERLRGYGGHCLPKDTKAWHNLIQDLGLDFSLIGSIIKDNEKFNK